MRCNVVIASSIVIVSCDAFIAPQGYFINSLPSDKSTATLLFSSSEFWPGQEGINALSPPNPDTSALASRFGARNAPEIIILPGFGNDESDYYDSLYPGCDMVSTLQRRGFDVTVLPIKQSMWSQVFTRGFFDINFWFGTSTAESRAYSWYLDIAREAIFDCAQRDKQALVVGHSAGGWLAMAAAGTITTLPSAVCGVVTLGAPHAAPGQGVFDPTRGVVADVGKRFSPSALGSCGICSVTVAGTSIVGDPEGNYPWDRAAAQSYATVIGGDGQGIIGDGIVPTSAALLKDANQQISFDAMHSVVIPGTRLPSTRWYGSEKCVDTWLAAAIDCILEAEKD